MRKINIIFLILSLIILGVSFYFSQNWEAVYPNFLKIFNNFGENFQQFNKTDLGNIINQVKKEILIPPPLKVGGEPNQVILAKEKIIAETNIQRYNNGLLVPLIENPKLDLAAKAKAEDMLLKQYFEHVSPTGLDPGELVKNYGYDYIVTGENLILGNFKDEQEAVQLWMESLGHRENILNKRFAEIGVAIVKGTYNGQTVWIGVQEFGLPITACSQPSVSLKDQIENNKNQLDQLSLQIDAKKQEIDNTNPRSEKYNMLVDEYNQLVIEYNALAQETKNIISQYNNQVNIFNQCVAG